MSPSLRDIETAYWEIRQYIHKTPLVYSNSFSRMTGAEVWLKCENLQKTGSFKVRGAFNKIIKSRAAKVVAASTGNHAQGVAFASAMLAVEARIVMPKTVSIVKEEAARGYGAQVELHGDTLSEALTYAADLKEYVFVHPYDDDAVIAGQGTIGIEVSEELKEFDFAIVPVGGGGLIAGISIALNALVPKAKVIGVQSEAAKSAMLSFQKKSKVPIEVPPAPTLADGIAVGRVGAVPLAIINEKVHDILSVSDDETAEAVLLLMERKKLVVEGAAATPLALLIKDAARFRGKRVVLVISGGNIDFCTVDRIVHKGLVAGGRVGVLSLVLEDAPGALGSITDLLARQRVNILGVRHDRYSGGLPFGRVRIDLEVETRSREHLEAIVDEIRKGGLAL